MGVPVGDNVGNDHGSRVLGDVVVDALGGSAGSRVDSCLIPACFLADCWKHFVQDRPKTLARALAGAGY